MAKMNDDRLLDILNSYEVSARNSLETRMSHDNKITNRYNGELYGDEIEGRSQVVSEDVKDTVESDMPSLIRSILNSGTICTFEPNNPNDEVDVAEAKAKTEYIDKLVRGQAESYKINYDFIKSAEMYKCAALKYMFEEVEGSTVEEYIVPFGGEVELLDKITSVKNYESHEVKKVTDNDDLISQTYKVKIKTKEQKISIIPIPNESLLISPMAESKDSAKLVGDISTQTRGNLLAQGYEKEVVQELTTCSGYTQGTTAKYLRFDDAGEMESGDYLEWVNQEVEIIDMYVMVDYDCDGISERMHIIKSGQTILHKEQFNHVPYAIASALITPYSLIGESRASQVLEVARVKTGIERGFLDNLSLVNNPETHYNNNVNPLDLMETGIGKLVGHKGESIPANNIYGFTVPSILQEALLGMQQQDQKKAKLVGNQLSSQGLNADDINNETATRFKGVEKSEAQKLALAIRNIVEVGYRSLYSGLAWMVQNFQDKKTYFKSDGKYIEVDPSKWRYDHELTVEIGLGAGNNEETISNLSSLWQIHSQLKAEGSPLTDEVKRYNVLSDLIKALELKTPSRYINNPEEPSELLIHQNEQLNQMVLQLQQQVQQAQNPLAESEKIKAEATLIKAQGDNQVKMLQEQNDMKQFIAEMMAKQEQSQKDIALKITELELKYNKDIDNQVKNNQI